jgi:site-specific DNA-adenine methylase
LVSHFPRQGRCYVEPFAGRGNVFWLACQCLHFEKWWLNDLQTALWFHALARVNPADIPDVVAKEAQSLWQARALAGDPLALVMEPFLTFSGLGYGKPYWFTGRRQGPSIKTTPGLVQSLQRASGMLLGLGVRLTGWDWQAMHLETLGPQDFVYLDPPYYGISVATYHAGQVDHQALARFLAGAPFRWAFSEYDQPFYRDILGPPRSQHQTRQTMAPGNTRKGQEQRCEFLWTNYEA